MTNRNGVFLLVLLSLTLPISAASQATDLVDALLTQYRAESKDSSVLRESSVGYAQFYQETVYPVLAKQIAAPLGMQLVFSECLARPHLCADARLFGLGVDGIDRPITVGMDELKGLFLTRNLSPQEYSSFCSSSVMSSKSKKLQKALEKNPGLSVDEIAKAEQIKNYWVRFDIPVTWITESGVRSRCIIVSSSQARRIVVVEGRTPIPKVQSLEIERYVAGLFQASTKVKRETAVHLQELQNWVAEEERHAKQRAQASEQFLSTVLSNVGNYKSAAKIKIVEPKSAPLPKSKFETEKEYEARVRKRRLEFPIVTAVHIVDGQSGGFGYDAETQQILIKPECAIEIGRHSGPRQFYEGQNAFGATRMAHRYEESIDLLEFKNCQKLPGHAGTIISREETIRISMLRDQARQTYDVLRAAYVFTYRPADADDFYERADRNSATYDLPIDRTTRYRGYNVTLIGIGLVNSSTNEVIYSKNSIASVADVIAFSLKQIRDSLNRNRDSPNRNDLEIDTWKEHVQDKRLLLDDF